MPDDWRLSLANSRLKGAKLVYRKFDHLKDNDHAHCEFCYEKISEIYSNTKRIGYCTLNGRHWICEVCYRDFRDLFQWTLVSDSDI